jgi:hypothetical protein
MRKISRLILRLCALLCLLGLSSTAFAHSGHVNWGPWRFDWEVYNNAGLAIRNVTFNNEEVLYKGSMPVIRVQYDDNACGPFADQISWGSLVDISNCGGGKVCQRTFTRDGVDWYEIGILAHIGSYRLYDVWYLSADGWINGVLWSKGLQCQVNHVHHPYWRMDFDINGFPSDQTFVFDNNRPDEGWGAGWHKHTNELNETKNPATGRDWFARDSPTGHGMWIIPSVADGTADSFSSVDAAPRLYHSAEDESWPFGAWGEVGYNNGEGLQEQDDVFWYVAHLHHHADEGSDQWHGAGPWFKVSR